MTIGCIRRTPDAKIMTMKDGRAHLPHKSEHAVNLETAAVVRLTVRDAHPGDARAMLAMPPTPQPCCRPPLVLLDRVGDKPYHGKCDYRRATGAGIADLRVRAEPHGAPVAQAGRRPRARISTPGGYAAPLGRVCSGRPRPPHTASP